MVKTSSKAKPMPVYLVGDSPMGELATPINAGAWSIWFINNLPAYRPGLTAFRRGLEVGMAHGYWLLGPFISLGPLRNEPNGAIAGLLSTVALVLIATVTMSLYAATTPPSPRPIVTTPKIPETFTSTKGWDNFALGFFVGGVGGALVAFVLLLGLSLFGLR